MKNTLRLTVLAAALGGAFPALAQTNAEVLNEIKALRDRVADLERKLQAAEAAKPKDGQWGMTPEQARELSRVTVKTEAMEDSRDAQGMKNLTISGYADPTYIYNRRQNRSGFQFLNNVADDGYNYDNSYFGAVAIDFQKETDSGTRYRLTLVPNRGTDSVIGNGGIVHEASVSVPLSDLQTRFIAGHLPDWSGYEYLQPTLNKLITHNLLFDFTLPTSFTGAGLDVTRGKWWMRGMLANLNASRNAQGETSPVITYRVDYSRGEYQGFGFAGVHGKAANFTENVVDGITGEVIGQPNSRLDLFEVDAYFIRGDVTVQGQVSFGQQKKASVSVDPVTGNLRDSRWWGLSALAAYKLDPRLEGIVRLDYLNNKKNGGGLLGYTYADDRNGIGPDINGDPNKGANRMALSLGASYLFDENTTLKAEYRVDRANLPVFFDVKSGGYRKSNQLFGTSVVVAF
jgi:Protein of unknown function (DUF3138)